MKSSKLWIGIPLIITVLTVLLAVLFTVILTSCDEPIQDEELIGTWKNSNWIIEFTSNRLFVTNATKPSDKAAYYYTTTGKKITLTMQENSRSEGETAYSITGTTLKIDENVKKLLRGTYHTTNNNSGGGVETGSDVGVPFASADPDKETYDTREIVDVSLYSITSGATIYYTIDGSTPTTSSTTYTASSPIPITSTTDATITLKAYAVKTGMTASGVMTETYIFKTPTIPAATPSANPNGGSYLTTDTATVTLTSTTAGATIYYTVDGSNPTKSSIPYTGSISITSETAATITLKAIAAKTGMTDSVAMSATYNFTTPPVSSVDTPKASPSGGSYTTSQTVSVTLTTDTSGASISYTLDGTTPTVINPGTTYAGPISISSSTGKTVTLKAIAVKNGTSSNVLTTAYVFTTSRLVNNSGDSATTNGTLRNIIGSANDGDVIEISSSVTTIQLNKEIAISKNITIVGNGVIITPSGSFPDKGNSLLSVSSGKAVTVRRVHFKSGKDSDTDGAGKGSAIYNRGTLTVESCIFTINNAVQGGAIYNSENSTTANGCTFYNNSATTGGAIYINYGTLTLTGNLFYGNTATTGPVVYRNGGTVTSGGYNVSDVMLVTFNSGSWTGGKSTDTTFSSLSISGKPFNDNFAPPIGSVLNSYMPSTAITGFPLTDFFGNTRNWPGSPGAVK